MTKRFTELTSSIDYYTIWDNNKDKGLTVEDAVDLLNEQHEEIEEIETTLDNMVTFKNKYRDKYKKIKKENEQLKQVLGSILIEVRRDISATNHSGEVKAFVNPNSFDLISNVLKKYGALKEWYE